MDKLVAGVDIGSTTAKSVVLGAHKEIWSALIPTGADPSSAGRAALNKALEQNHLSGEVDFIVATGYGRVSADFADRTITEIACHGRGAYYLDPLVRTIIDIGGQDAKIISLGEDGIVTDFAMNDKCASGTGRFLESAAQLVLHVSLADLSRLSSTAVKKAPVTSNCTVFAQTELISLLAAGESVQNVIAGLHASIASKVASMAKRLGVRPKVMMTGGVAKNSGVVRALSEELGIDMVVPLSLDPQLVGALGAAFIAHEISTKRVDKNG